MSDVHVDAELNRFLLYVVLFKSRKYPSGKLYSYDANSNEQAQEQVLCERPLVKMVVLCLLCFAPAQSLKNTKQQRASFREMAGKCVLTLWLTTLCPVAHAICSSRWLCSAPRWLTKTPRALPWAFQGEWELLSATKRFQMAPKMWGSEDECWKEHWFPLWSMISHALERSSPDAQKRLKKHTFFISISFPAQRWAWLFWRFVPGPPKDKLCIHELFILQC